MRAALPQPPRADREVVADDSPGVSIEIDAGFMDVLAVLTDGARRTDFVEGVRRVEQDQAVAFIGFPVGGILGFSPVTHRGIISSITPIVWLI